MPGNGAAASYGDLLITSLVVLAGVCIAAFIVVKVVGRFLATGRMRGAHLLDIVARLPLEPRRSLYVVEVAGKTLLVGTSEMGLSVLSELDGNEVKARAVPKQSFGELVRSAWLRKRATGDGSAETRSARVGATFEPSAPSDVSAETRSAHVGATFEPSAPSDVSAEETRRVHVGASVASSKDGSSASSVASRDVSVGARSAHVGASVATSKDGPSTSSVASSQDDSAETRSAHVGAKSEREGA